MLGDCLQLKSLTCEEQTGVIAIGYEHYPHRVALAPLLDAFQVIARHVVGFSFAEEHSQYGLAWITRFINNW